MKVCIIGDGLTSLVLAKAMINRDIFVDVIHSKKHQKLNQTRTLGISKSNIDYFNKNITNINKILWDIKKIKIYTENSHDNEIIKFSDLDTKLFSILQNKKLFDQLNYELKKNKFFNYKKNKSYNHLVNARYNLIINSDISHEITSKFFSKKIEKNYRSIAYTTVVDHNKLQSNDTAIQIFTNKGPIAFLPISNTRTSIVYSFRILEIQKKIDIKDLIKKFNPKYQIKKIHKISKFNLKSMNLRKYYIGNILAFGDLLHKLHPLAGQGFNMSIRDINDLIEIIDNKINLGLPIDGNVCLEFQNKTKSKNYIFSKGIDFIYEIFNFESKTKNNFFSSAIKLVGKNKSFNKYFRKFADIGLRI